MTRQRLSRPGVKTDQSAENAESGETNSSVKNDHDEIIHARSVMLGLESLGVVAKFDLVEVTLETGISEISDLKSHMRESAVRAVCPVESKTGAPRATAIRAAVGKTFGARLR